ncbi:Probable pectinesterase/pectinesterase inhibitor 41 [Linum perenne]
MAASISKLLPFSSAIMLIFMFIVPSSPATLARPPTTNAAAPGNFCATTPYPSFCRSTLPYNRTSTIHDYTRKSVKQSLSQSRQFLRLINYLLRTATKSKPFQTLIPPLQDCKFLAQLNVDSLSNTMNTINSKDNLPSFQASDLQTLLSATLTNLDTCFDGIRAKDSSSTVINNLVAPLLNGTKYCSVSLALFAHGWVPPPRKKKGGDRVLSERPIGHVFDQYDLSHGLPLRMSNQDRRVFESFSKRKLLQAVPNGGVLVSQMVVVNKKKGLGNFTSINDAIDAAPNSMTGSVMPGSSYFVIYVTRGLYEEYISIPKNKQSLMMIGDGIGKTTITGNRSVVDNSTTFNSSTFAVVSPGFVAVGITFRNTAGPTKMQAVAVRNGADMSAFFNCSFEGYQDTLYVHSLRQFYRDCDIYGTIDYIFGNAAAVFQNCRIMTRLPLPSQFNAITAQGRTDPNQNTGISIQNCSIKEAKDLASSNGTTRSYLGRPWKPYSRTVVMQSYIASFIDPTGWSPWSGNASASLDTLYYAEFNNSGIGARTNGRVNWPGFRLINETDAGNFTVVNFTQGDVWLPATGVPFATGLLLQ